MRIQDLLVSLFLALIVASVAGSVFAQEDRSPENPFSEAIEKLELEKKKVEPRSTPPPAKTTLQCVAEKRQCSCMGGAASGDCRVMNAFLCVGEDRYKRMKCDERGQCSCRIRPPRG